MSKNNEEQKSAAGLILGLCWLILFLLVLIFIFVYKDKLKETFFDKDNKSQTEVNSDANQDAVTDEEYHTIFSYQTNSNMEINALFNDYYLGLTTCNADLLKSLVTNPSVYDDMSVIEQKSKLITNYFNIVCYTLPGYTDNATIVYTVANISIAGVQSTPLDINQFYVVNDGSKYLIENGVLDENTINYIDSQNKNPDIQQLYQDVKNNIDYCILNDSAFANFYNQINGIN